MGHLRRFLKACGADGDEPPGMADVKAHLLEMVGVRGYSTAYVNQFLSALGFFYRHVAPGTVDADALPRQRKERRLPEVLTRREVEAVIEAAGGARNRALLMLTYAAGLRVSEVVALRERDLEVERGLLRVRRGKGRKDRAVMLSRVALRAVRAYRRGAEAGPWLFPGARPGRHLSIRSAQRIFARARDEAGIDKEVGIHVLRHSFATHLMEEGTPIRHIQELLGHASLATTELYTHVTARELAAIPSPLDRLMGEAE